jgi:hypothetical protein
MVHNTQDYWGFGLCLSSGIKKKHTKKPMFQKMAVPVLKSGVGHTYCCWVCYEEKPQSLNSF